MSAAIAPAKPRGPARQGDALLWTAGALIAVLGGTWLVLSEPWSAGDPPPALPALPQPAAAPTSNDAASSALATGLDNPLRMAQLAFEAGMLIDPDEYSAWALYRQVLRAEPDNAAAAQGLLRVADELVRRAHAAVEQGRFADARTAAERILADFPTHDGALALAASLGTLPARATAPTRELVVPVVARPEITARHTMPAAEAPEEPAAAPPPPAERAAPRPARPAAKPQVEVIAEALQRFEAALAENRLLIPLDGSAKHHAAELAALDPSHPSTRAAREQLAAAFLARATQALESLDTTAANTWIDEAALANADDARIGAARAAVTDRLAAMEAARPLPASALIITDYVAPAYPDRALARGIAGWVDVEFTVATDGTTKNIIVAGASHESFFRREAAAAVEQWRFQPRTFMGRQIEQRSYTRIRFVQ